MTSKNTLTFHEAHYIYGSEKEDYVADELSKMKESKDIHFDHVKSWLFCPACESAPLKFTDKAADGSRRAFFSTIDSEKHESYCLYRHPRAPKKLLLRIDENPDGASVEKRLTGLLRLLDSITPPKNHPCLVEIDKNGRIFNWHPDEERTVVQKYYIPQWKLSQSLDNDCIDIPTCYYGKVSLKWHTNDKAQKCPHELYVFRKAEDDPTCILRFTAAAFQRLPESVRKADDIRFDDALAVFIQLSNKFPSADVKREDGKPIYTGYVGVLTKIIFGSTSPNQ